jgi:hypothetical protein
MQGAVHHPVPVGIPQRDGARWRSAAWVDRATEEGDQSLDGGCLVSDFLGRTEATRAGLLIQLGTDERQRLFGHIIRQLGGLARGLGEVPAADKEVVETDLQSLRAGDRPERATICAFEDSRLAERGPQRGCGVPVGANGVIFDNA